MLLDIIKQLRDDFKPMKNVSLFSRVTGVSLGRLSSKKGESPGRISPCFGVIVRSYFLSHTEGDGKVWNTVATSIT